MDGKKAKQIKTRFNRWLENLYQVPVIGILVKAAINTGNYGKDLAASIAFFSFFSLFPLLLGLAAIASRFIDPAKVQDYLNRFLTDALPATATVVTENLDALIKHRGTAGVISVLVLIWSARKMVGALSRGINHALELDYDYDKLLNPLRDFLLTVLVSLLMVVPIVFTPVMEIIDSMELPFLGRGAIEFLDIASDDLLNFALAFAVVLTIYRLLPYKKCHWKPIIISSVVVSIGFQLAKKVFVVYVGNIDKFEAVYGSLTSIIILMLWLYFSAYLILFGASLMNQLEPHGGVDADLKTAKLIH